MATHPTVPMTMIRARAGFSPAAQDDVRMPGGNGHDAPARVSLRRVAYGAWRRLPRWLQRRVVRATVPSVTLGVCAVVADARGRLLPGHHTYRRQPWGLTGGFARRGEQPSAALARELREELDVAARVGPVVAAEVSPDGGHLTLYYRATLLARPRGDGVEIDTWRYVALPDAEALLGAPRPSWLAYVREALAAPDAPAA